MKYADLDEQLESWNLSGPLEISAYERINGYFELRAEWLGTHNVAGPESRRSTWTLDFPDALAVRNALADEIPLIDVGSGSGTPGLLVACMCPDRPVYLVEPIAKRTAFLRSAAARLGLKNVRVVRDRWPCSLEEPVGQVISRAVVSPEDWPQLAASRAPGTDLILRMLAAHRPGMPLAAYRCVSTVEYDLGGHGARLVERWEPSSAE